MLERQLQLALDKRRHKATLRNLTVFPTIPSTPGAGLSSTSAAVPAPLVDFSSNDYLSLSSCSRVRSDFLSLFQSCSSAKIGSTGSRLLDGNSPEHEQLEIDLAGHFEAASSLLFNSGYDANVSLFSTLPQPDDIILYDELVHASVHDGIRKSRTAVERRISFQHNSSSHLDQVLETLSSNSVLGEGARGPNVFLAVESIYSMDGDAAPLSALLAVLAKHVPRRERRCVVVDEAHSTAVYGAGGRGYCHALGLHERVDIRLMTFGKGMGSSGAVVLCRPVVRHFLINYARPLIFSTSLSYPSLVSIRACLLALQDGRSERRARHLFERTRQLVRGLQEIAADSTAPLVTLPRHLHRPMYDASDASAAQLDGTDIAALSVASPSPIIPLLSAEARPLALYLQSHGLLGRPICYPTVPKGEDRVRICLHADNSTEDVARLVSCVRAWAASEERQREAGGGAGLLAAASKL